MRFQGGAALGRVRMSQVVSSLVLRTICKLGFTKSVQILPTKLPPGMVRGWFGRNRWRQEGVGVRIAGVPRGFHQRAERWARGQQADKVANIVARFVRLLGR